MYKNLRSITIHVHAYHSMLWSSYFSNETYGSLSLSLSLGRPRYSDNSWNKTLMKILLADVVSSSLSLMTSRTWTKQKPSLTLHRFKQIQLSLFLYPPKKRLEIYWNSLVVVQLKSFTKCNYTASTGTFVQFHCTYKFRTEVDTFFFKKGWVTSHEMASVWSRWEKNLATFLSLLVSSLWIVSYCSLNMFWNGSMYFLSIIQNLWKKSSTSLFKKF